MQLWQEIFSEIREIARQLGTEELLRPLLAVTETGNTSIHIAVLGQFKSGKSSLVNHLAGESLFPVGVVPLTSVVTLLLKAGADIGRRDKYGRTPLSSISFPRLAEYLLRKHPLIRLSPVYMEELGKRWWAVFANHPGYGAWVGISLALLVTCMMLREGLFRKSKVKFDRVNVWLLLLVLPIVIFGGGLLLMFSFSDQRYANELSILYSFMLVIAGGLFFGIPLGVILAIRLAKKVKANPLFSYAFPALNLLVAGILLFRDASCEVHHLSLLLL